MEKVKEKQEVNNKLRKILNDLSDYQNDGIQLRQQPICDYFNIVRQSGTTVLNGNEISLNKEQVKKINELSMFDIESQFRIVYMSKMSGEILESIKQFASKQDDKGIFIDKSYEGIKYLHHWITSDKYKKIHKEGLFMNIRNYHIRKNPINIFMKSFKRYDRLVLTVNIDKINKIVKECSFTKYDIESDEISLLEKKCNINFSDFVQYVNEVCTRERKKLIVYRDLLSDELEYISSKIKKQENEILFKYELYDASRFFKRNEDNLDDVGPKIEIMLKRFGLLNEHDEKKILIDSKLRGRKIFELIKKVSLIDLTEDDWRDEDAKQYLIRQREKAKGEK